MIVRLVEYARYCDNEDCRYHYHANVQDWHTREACEQAALEEGWVRCTRKRWLCPDCAKALAPKAPDGIPT